MGRFEIAEQIKQDMKKKAALEKAFHQDKAGDKAGSDEGSDEEDEDKIAEEKEAGALSGSWILAQRVGAVLEA